MEHNPSFLGILEDLRSAEEKQKDYVHEEIATATDLNWVEKTSWKSYPIKRQYFTLECVAQSTTKALGINEKKENGSYEDLCAEFFYDFRENKPGGGMGWLDAMKLATTIAACKAFRIPQRTHEYEKIPPITQEMIDEAKKYRGISYVSVINKNDIDTVARIIEEQGYCIVWFWFDINGKEWWKKEPTILYPNLGTYQDTATRHALVATDYGLRNGKKVIKIEDSAGNNSAEDDQNRFINEAFMPRCFQAGYVVDLLPEPAPIPPVVHQFNINLYYGMVNNSEVKLYQDILKSKGFFPNVPSTGNFYGLTAKGNELFQKAHGISPTARNSVGPKTRAILNSGSY